MSHWNYRLIVHDQDEDPSYHWCGIHEIFYNDEGKIQFWSQFPEKPIASYENGHEPAMKEMFFTLIEMLKDIQKSPPLSYKKLENFEEENQISKKEDEEYWEEVKNPENLIPLEDARELFEETIFDKIHEELPNLEDEDAEKVLEFIKNIKNN